MWTRRTSWFTAAFLAAVVMANGANAQMGSGMVPKNDRLNDPFGVQTPPTDWEYFAPVDVDGYGHVNNARLGWFGEFTFTKMWLPQPDNVLIFERVTNDLGLPVVGDRLLEDLGGFDVGGGNRLEVGWFGDTGGGTAAGWLAAWTHLNGSPLHEVIAVSRIGRFNSEDGNAGNNFSGDDDDAGPVFPLQDRNDWETGAMDYWVAAGGINSISLDGFEVNRAYRLAPLHYGARIEPFFGFRYLQVRDYTQRDTYERQDENGAPLPFPSDDDARVDQLYSEMTTWHNRMALGQIGVRFARPVGTVTFSADFRAFAGPNYQQYELRERSLESFYPDIGNDNPPITERTELNYFADSYTELAIGTEIRTQAAWYVTRDIALTAGAEVFGLGRGLGRSNIFGDNDQAMWAVGGSFGLQVRR